MAGDLKDKLSKDDLEQLLGEKVVSYEATALTAAGDNYGSIMLAVDVTLQSGKLLRTVAKLFPEPEETRRIFNSPLSMRKEIDIYKLVSPEFDKIQEEHSVPLSERLNVLCSCPGARLTLQGYDDHTLADENSVLMLENLRAQGYRVADRILGQDLKHAELVLTRLAKFHATALAIKHQKPDVFRDKILKACVPFKVRLSSYENEKQEVKRYTESLRMIPICEQNIRLLEEHLNMYIDYAHSDDFRAPKEPFATMVHDDLWTNNMMFKYNSENDQEPIDLKFYDFQVVRYGSPATDVIFYLFTSTKSDVISLHFDRLLKLYHDTFEDWLKTLGCDTNLFSFSDFLNEVNSVAPFEITHILYWLFPIKLHKDQLDEFQALPDKLRIFNNDFIEQATETVTQFLKRNWL